MSIPPVLVSAARLGWHWQWNQLMNGLAPADKEGNYIRPASNQLKAIIPSKQDLDNRSKDSLPHLIIGRSCPWAHRTWLVHKLRNLDQYLTIHVVDADHQGGRWKLDPPWLGCNSLIDLYKRCGSPPTHRATVPVLIDPDKTKDKSPLLLGNESAQLVEALNQWPSNKHAPDLAPIALKEEIENWQNILQYAVNDGVYRCGFARTQSAYDRASNELFSALEKVNQSLSSKGPWLCGEQITLADVRLFPTLIRWEMIYMPLFGCSQKPLWAFTKLWEWRQGLMRIPSIASTCDSSAWRKDYYGALFPLRPSHIIPSGPDLNQIVKANPPKHQ